MDFGGHLGFWKRIFLFPKTVDHGHNVCQIWCLYHQVTYFMKYWLNLLRYWSGSTLFITIKCLKLVPHLFHLNVCIPSSDLSTYIAINTPFSNVLHFSWTDCSHGTRYENRQSQTGCLTIPMTDSSHVTPQIHITSKPTPKQNRQTDGCKWWTTKTKAYKHKLRNNTTFK